MRRVNGRASALDSTRRAFGATGRTDESCSGSEKKDRQYFMFYFLSLKNARSPERAEREECRADVL